MRIDLETEVAPTDASLVPGNPVPFVDVAECAFLYGKHAGRSLRDVDASYLCWVLDDRTRDALALSDVEVEAVQMALNALAPPVPTQAVPVAPPVPPELIARELSPTQKAVIEAAQAFVASTPPPSPPTVPPELFGPPPVRGSGDIVWTEEQKKALDEIDEWYYGGSTSFYALTGPAGTGKTTILKEIVWRYPGAACAAMTGKAALRMSQCTMQPATTLHKILYYPPRGGSSRFTVMRDPPASFVIIDESSMMSPSVFVDLKRWATRGVRFLLVGDSFQLPPVITDKEERDRYGEDWSVFSQVPGSALSTVMRNAGGVLRAATFVRTTNKLLRKSDLDAPGLGYEYIQVADPVKRAVDDYCADPDDHVLITWRNAIRMKANAMIRARVGKDGPLPDEGEPVLLRKNGQGHLNGEIVMCGGFEVGPKIGPVETLLMTVAGTEERILVSVHGGNPEYGSEFFDGGFWATDWSKYNSELEKLQLPDPIPITWGYVLTAHAAQGSEARRVTVFLASGDERSSHFKKQSTLPDGNKTTFAARFLYTSLTRGKERSAMILGQR